MQSLFREGRESLRAGWNGAQLQPKVYADKIIAQIGSLPSSTKHRRVRKETLLLRNEESSSAGSGTQWQGSSLVTSPQASQPAHQSTLTRYVSPYVSGNTVPDSVLSSSDTIDESVNRSLFESDILTVTDLT